MVPTPSFFTVSELKSIFDWISTQHHDLTILYICHKDPDLRDDRFGTLPMPDYDQLLKDYSGRVHVFEDLIAPVLAKTRFGDLPRLTLKNSLQIALLSRADIAFSVQGGLQHLLSKLVPFNHVLHLWGQEHTHQQLSYACQSQNTGLVEMIVYTTRDALASHFKHNRPCVYNVTCPRCDQFPRCPCHICGGLSHWIGPPSKLNPKPTP